MNMYMHCSDQCISQDIKAIGRLNYEFKSIQFIYYALIQRKKH